MSPRSFFVGAFLAATFVSCGSSSGSSGSSGAPSTQPAVTQLFSPSVKNVVFEVDYAAGAEPYVGSAGELANVWNLFHANALAVFDGRKTVIAPSKLADMEKLDDVPAQDFSNKDLLDIASRHRDQASDGENASFYIVFVNGYWLDDDGTERKDVLGVSVADSGVIGMFKPAIKTPAGSKGPPLEYVEQLSLIHELGHAVGFVDNGVPVADNNKAHIDTDHPHDCTNPQCAMSFANEAAAGAAAFAAKLILNDHTVILGQECLSDARILETQQLSQ